MLRPLKSLMLPNLFYKGKSVLITGGGSGLGKQMAKDYCKLGANVTIIGRTKDKLHHVANEIFHETKNRPFFHAVDVRNRSEIVKLADNLIEKKQLPQIIVNNAAGNFINKSENLSENAWNSVIDIVLKGTINVTSVFGKKLIDSKLPGTFVNISTTYAETGSSFVVPSGVAKAGCNNLTKSLASEWGKHGIRLLSVAPGPIYTEGAFSRLDPGNNFSNMAKKKLPLMRFGEKEELSNLVTYLTSDYCNWMTGQIITFDGGEVIGNSGEFNFLHMLKDKDWEIYSKL